MPPGWPPYRPSPLQASASFPSIPCSSGGHTTQCTCQSDICRSQLRDSWPFLIKGSDPAGTIPFIVPPWTRMVCPWLWCPYKTPEEWPRESQGWWPRTLTSAELLSQLNQCQPLLPSALLIKPEKTKPCLLKLILLVFFLTCRWAPISLLIGFCVSNPNLWWSVLYPADTVSARVTSQRITPHRSISQVMSLCLISTRVKSQAFTMVYKALCDWRPHSSPLCFTLNLPLHLFCSNSTDPL